MRILLGFAMTLTLVGTAMAGTICPGAPTGTTFPHPPDPNATGCNVVITINANGTATTVITDATAYENSEDAIIGIVNNSSTPLGSINLSGAGIFGLEGDGICTFTFPGNSYCSAAAKAGTDPADYQGPTSTYTNFSSGNSGTVVFSPAVAANGGSTYFSLEGIPTASIGVTPNGGAPAPSSLGLLAIGLALVGGWTFRSEIRSRLFAAK
jgi:hypothetical protein